MKLLKTKGSTSNILEIFIQDTSVTTGAGLTGLSSASSGLTCYYHRNTALAGVAVSLVTMTVGTFTSSGFKEVDSTNLPGVYQLCLPDAAFATGADSVVAELKGATNMAPVLIEIQLTGIDLANATSAGIGNLDAAVSTRLASGSYTTPPTVAAIRAEIDANSTKLDAAVSTRSTLTAAGVWNEAIAGHLTSGTTGEKLNAAASAGDPWSTLVPAAYAVGTAGYILGGLFGTTVTVISPIDENGNLEIYVGDDYAEVHNRNILIENAAGTWPDLSSPGLTALTLYIYLTENDGLVTSIVGEATVPTGAGQTLSFEPTATNTGRMRKGTGQYYYRAKAEFSDGDIVTLSAGQVTAK